MASLSDALNSIQNGISGISGEVKEFLGTPTGSAVGSAVVGASLVGTGVLVSSAIKSKSAKTSRKRKRKKITHTKRGLKQDRKRRSKQKWELAYQRRKRRKGKKARRSGRVKYTKNGQPYIILKSGKARFIKGRRRR